MLHVAVLISGSGRTLRNLLDYQDRGCLQNVCIDLVISNNPNALGLQYAQRANAKAEIVDHRLYDSDESFSETIYKIIEDNNCDFIVMAGFMRKLIIKPEWANKVVNIHPSLIPSFCGPGFYGKKVHQAALDMGVKVSGCTVHFATNYVDDGPIIIQKTVPVYDTDDVQTLADRILEKEFEALPEAIELISEKRVTVCGRIVKIDRR